LEKRKKLEADKESVLADADNDADMAEHGHKLTLIAQSIATRQLKGRR